MSWFWWDRNKLRPIHSDVHSYVIQKINLPEEWRKQCYLMWASKLANESSGLSQDRIDDLGSVINGVRSLYEQWRAKIAKWKAPDVVNFLSRGPSAVKLLSEDVGEMQVRLSDEFILQRSKWVWFDSNDMFQLDHAQQLVYNKKSDGAEYFYAFIFCFSHQRLVPKILDGLDLLIISFFRSINYVTWNSFIGRFDQFIKESDIASLFMGKLSVNLLEERIRFFALVGWIEVGCDGVLM